MSANARTSGTDAHDMIENRLVQRRFKHTAGFMPTRPDDCRAPALKAGKHNPDGHAGFQTDKALQAKARFREAGNAACKPCFAGAAQLDANQHGVPPGAPFAAIRYWWFFYECHYAVLP